LLTGLACGLLLAGCAGAKAPAPRARSAASPAPTYAATGNAICAEQLAALNRLPQPATAEQTIAYLPPALTIMRRETTRLAALDRPGAGTAKLDAALTSTRALSTLLQRLLHELKHGMVELAALATVQTKSTAMRAQIDARFREAGLPRCAE